MTFTQGNSDTVLEGSTNQYFTTGRFNFALSQKTTNDLTEGTNNYYYTLDSNDYGVYTQKNILKSIVINVTNKQGYRPRHNELTRVSDQF